MTSETLLQIIKDIEREYVNHSIGDYEASGFNSGLLRAISIIEDTIDQEGL